MNILAKLKTLMGDIEPGSGDPFDDLVRHGLRAVGDRRLDDKRVGLRSRAEDADRYREPGGAEEVWLAKHLAEAVRFIEQHTGSANGSFNPALLDAAFGAWNRCPVQEREEERVVVNALGAAFGQWLVDTHSMSWVVLTDGNEEDFGVRHDRIAVTVLPLSIAARRMQSVTEDFFSVLGRLIEREIARAAPPSNP